MKGLHFLEFFVAVSIQAALLVAACELVSRSLHDVQSRDRLWNACHAALLVAMLGGATLPHLRLWQANAAAKSLPLALGQSLAVCVAIVWGAGAAAGLARLIWGMFGTLGLLKECRPLADEELASVFGASGNDAATFRDVRFFASDRCTSPFCCQLQRATVVVPRLMLTQAADEAATVLRHELEHLRRGHPLGLFLQRLAGALLWFHPAVWWAGRQASRYREFACDDAAVRSADEAAAYLRSLLRLAQNAPAGALAGLGFGARGSLLVERSQRLVHRAWHEAAPLCSSRRSGWPVALMPLAMSLVLVVWIPLDARASRRSLWSPWPQWSARALMSLGIEVRDYEIDGHRFGEHRGHAHRPPETPPGRSR